MDTTLNLSASEDLSKLDFDGSCRNREFKTASLQDLINEFTNNGNAAFSQQIEQLQEAQQDKDQQFHKDHGHSQNFIIKIRKGLPFKQQVNLLKYLPKIQSKKEVKQVPTEEATSPDRISTAHTLRSDGWSKLQEEEICHNKDKNAELMSKKNTRMSVQETQTQNELLDKGNQLVQGRRIHKSMALIQTTCPEIQKISLPHLPQNECSSPFLKSDTEEHHITTTTIAHLHESKDESHEGLKLIDSYRPYGQAPSFRSENIHRRKFTLDGPFSHRLMIENIISKKRNSEKIEMPQPESPLLKDHRSDSHPNLYQHHPFDPKPEGGYRKSLFGSRIVRKSMV